ncbi:MAG: DNA-binding response regulator [Paenibacillaceae bacterium]|nr:MAG: DNA-binding response regulator [Paenibacillaceae bacterium]
MHKVLLVDDEVFARTGLRGLIPWNSLGFEIVAEAENGEEALQMIRDEQPDLVVTDIRMPVLDGLELIRTVKEQEIGNPKFIIISGYNDFKYAQQAVRFGVEDFILKPIDEAELEDTLKRVAESLKRDQLLEAGHPALHLSLLESLLTGRLDKPYIPGAAAALGLPAGRELCYIIAEVNDVGAEADTESADAGHWKAELIRAAAALTGGREPLLHEHGEWTAGLLLPLGESLQSWEAAAEKLRQAVRLRGGVLRLYVGKPAGTPEQIHRSYRSAKQTMDYKYALDGQAVLSGKDTEGLALVRTELPSDLFDRLLHAMEERDANAAEAVLDEIFDTFRSSRFAPDAVAASIARLIRAVNRTVQAMDGDEQALAGCTALAGWQEKPRTLQGLKRLAAAFVEEASDYMAELRKEKAKGSIHKIKQHIERHFRENISLKVIAQQYYMNPVYLGQLFKKTYGVYFNDFLLDLRIQEAKRLLRQTDMRIYEIAAEVGFSNPEYFAAQFEKVVSMTPKEYRTALTSKT